MLTMYENQVELGEGELVCGNWGEVSQPTHLLKAALVTSKVRVAGPSRRRRRILRSEAAESSLAGVIGYMGRGQYLSLIHI